MSRSARHFTLASTVLLASLMTWLATAGPRVMAQGPDAQQKLTEIKQAIANNQHALARYTWQQQETISVNGEVKKQDLYQVQLGPDGKPVKVALGQTPSPPGGRPRGIKHRIEENYEKYGQEVASLVQSYAQPDPGKLQQLYAQGNVAVKSGGARDVVAVAVSNYEKQGDSMTMTFNRTQKALLGIQVASYLTQPSDAVTMSVQFAKLPDGTNHVSLVNVNGESKNLTVQDRNVNYQLRSQ
ncbi:MAG: hypothetical protein ACXVA3_03745 [Vulcanimicrobiaceae bacterium]